MASTNDMLKNIEESLAHLCELRGYDKEFAKTAVNFIELKLCQRFQGDQVRFKKPIAGKQARNKKIKKMFNGTNMDAICTRFGVTASTVYRVIKQ